MTIQQNTLTQTIIDRRKAYMSLNYGRYPIVMARGRDCELFDTEGKRYLDLFAGFGAGLLGHCHPDLVAAVERQARGVWHPGNLFHSEPQTQAAEAIAKHGFGGRSFFCHSGADANEAAFKLARLYGKSRPGKTDPTQGGRYKIISTTQSFHGRSFGAMAATGQPAVSRGYEPLLPGFCQVAYDDLDAVRSALDDQTVAVIVEPIQGEGGINIPGDGYLPGLRQLCDERDLLLICDEVWTGCGRTGRYFAHQHWGIEPDIMTLAKGVGGGLPVGVMCARPDLAELNDSVKRGGVAHATTLGGNCISMAASAAVFKVLERDGLVRSAAELGEGMLDRLQELAGRTERVSQVRGKGLFIGIEMAEECKPIVQACMERGVLINAARESVLRLAPPLVINPEQIDEGLSVIEEVILG